MGERTRCARSTLHCGFRRVQEFGTRGPGGDNRSFRSTRTLLTVNTETRARSVDSALGDGPHQTERFQPEKREQAGEEDHRGVVGVDDTESEQVAQLRHRDYRG
jgi:hypothetical protein